METLAFRAKPNWVVMAMLLGLLVMLARVSMMLSTFASLNWPSRAKLISLVAMFVLAIAAVCLKCSLQLSPEVISWQSWRGHIIVPWSKVVSVDCHVFDLYVRSSGPEFRIPLLWFANRGELITYIKNHAPGEAYRVTKEQEAVLTQI